MMSCVSWRNCSYSICWELMNVLPHIVSAPIMLASATSSSVEPYRRAASVWQSATYRKRVAPETATPISSLYLFGIFVSLSQKSRAIPQKPCKPPSGICSSHCGTRPNDCLTCSYTSARVCMNDYLHGRALRAPSCQEGVPDRRDGVPADVPAA